jgi:hypothetical protein
MNSSARPTPPAHRSCACPLGRATDGEWSSAAGSACLEQKRSQSKPSRLSAFDSARCIGFLEIEAIRPIPLAFRNLPRNWGRFPGTKIVTHQDSGRASLDVGAQGLAPLPSHAPGFVPARRPPIPQNDPGMSFRSSWQGGPGAPTHPDLHGDRSEASRPSAWWWGPGGTSRETRDSAEGSKAGMSLVFRWMAGEADLTHQDLGTGPRSRLCPPTAVPFVECPGLTLRP